MTGPGTTHHLSIAGQRIAVRSAADEAYVRALAALVEERVRRAEGQGAGPAGAAMLAALGLADELLRTREALAQLRDDVRDRTDALLAELLPVKDE